MIPFLASGGRSSAPAREIGSKKDRFIPPKYSAYTAPARSDFPWRNTVKSSPSVTTTHVFSPNQRRKAALLLPNWLRNSAVIPLDYTPRGAGQRP